MAEITCVVFAVQGELYGLPIEDVERILTLQQITRIPKSPESMLGVIEVRNATVPCFDLSTRLSLGKSESPQNDIVVNRDSLRYALRVCRVNGIVKFTDEDLEPSPEICERHDDPFVDQIGKWNEKLVVILRPDGVLPTRLKEVAGKHLEKAAA